MLPISEVHKYIHHILIPILPNFVFLETFANTKLLLPNVEDIVADLKVLVALHPPLRAVMEALPQVASLASIAGFLKAIRLYPFRGRLPLGP